MIRSSFIAILLIFVVCAFCGQDFVALGCHSWCCKQRINQPIMRNNACDVIVGTRLAHQYKNTIACYIIEKAKAQIEVTKLKKCRTDV